MKRLTASKLGLFTACQYPWRDEVSWLDDKGGEAANHGKAIHAEIEERLNGGFNVSETADWIAEAPESPFDFDGKRYVEHALAWDHRTGRVVELPAVADRQYPDGYTVYGTADLILESDTEIRVIDWKTGRRENVTEAYRNEQLRFLAAAFVAADRYREYKRVRLELWFVGEEKFVDIAVWDPEFHLGKLADYVERVSDSRPAPNNGCRYCPARVNCPAALGALEIKRRIPESLAEVVTNEEAQRLLQIKKLAERVADHCDALAKDWARLNGGIRTDDSKVWGPTESNYKSLDGKAALELARALGATDEQLAGCERESVRVVFRETRRALQQG